MIKLVWWLRDLASSSHEYSGGLMVASVVTTRLAKAIEPTLEQSGFVRNGRIFLRAEGNLNGFVELVPYPKADSATARFKVEWGITLPGIVSRYNRPNISRIHVALGPALVPPRKRYAGSSPQERSIDPVWGVVEGSKDDARECAGALVKALEKDVVPPIIALSKPGALLQEFTSKREGRLIGFAGSWRGDAIYLLIEDGPIDQVRELLSEGREEGDFQNDVFRSWIENRLERREKQAQT
jgi:hypothetical protein